MNKRLQGFIAGILCAVLCMGVFAKTASQTIEAVYRDIKIFIDGFQIDPKDTNGNTVEPFIYNGSTYLPLRAVGEALGKEVSWDGATASAYLGKVPGKQPNWMVQCPPYQLGDVTAVLRSEGNFVTMAGDKYSDGLKFRNYYNGKALFNLNGKYKSLTFTLGISNASTRGATFNFYIDGELAKTIEYGAEDMPKTYTINLNYGNQLKIECKHHYASYSCDYGLMEGYFE